MTVLFLSQVAFIFAVFLSLGGGRTITPESSPWDTISDEFLEELILDEKNEEKTAQIEGSGALRLTEEPNSAGRETPQNSSDDASNKATENTLGTAVNMTTLPEATARRLRRDIDWEPSCTIPHSYNVIRLPSGKQVSNATACHLTASDPLKCTSSIKIHGKRACEKSYVKMEGLAIAVCRCAS